MKAKNFLSPEKDPRKRKRKTFWHLWSRFWKICPNRTLLLTFGNFFRKKMNEPESMKCDSFNCLCLVLGVKHSPLISLLRVKAFRWIISSHWIPQGQVICTTSPQVQWWLVLKEFQTTVSMHQVKCINNPGAMRQIPTQLGQLTTAYEIICNKTIYFSRLFL